ncbi:hypothetical protein HBI04_144200 [Parastagonospora nodorum]|nr:hypothetical protein HBH51_100960 [Parastagonospora nodorum]KAH4044744.1 hypothetical protein HBH49_212560 [Parastagonospora nodorum]KAH4116758.1 hypothetical protein HBH47_162410 [Parastagonospora nodorum]KAH4160058.1 hypothetical protein HBH43_181150 [Parastagonospora nodorum]KAH4258392.1 hypothetical protein HBI03_144850 [Parastagonospora nodorum]
MVCQNGALTEPQVFPSRVRRLLFLPLDRSTDTISDPNARTILHRTREQPNFRHMEGFGHTADHVSAAYILDHQQRTDSILGIFTLLKTTRCSERGFVNGNALSPPTLGRAEEVKYSQALQLRSVKLTGSTKDAAVDGATRTSIRPVPMFRHHL